MWIYVDGWTFSPNWWSTSHLFPYGEVKADAVNSTHQCQMFRSLSVHCQAYETLKIISAIQPVKINNIQQVTVYYTVLFTRLLAF